MAQETRALLDRILQHDDPVARNRLITHRPGRPGSGQGRGPSG